MAVCAFPVERVQLAKALIMALAALLVAVNVATADVTSDPADELSTRPWPELLRKYAATLDELKPPMDELRKTFLLFYWAAFENDVKAGMSLVAERYYDLAKKGMATRRDLEKAAHELDKRAKEEGRTNPHDAYSPSEKLAVLRDDLKLLEVCYIKLTTAADAAKVGLPNGFEHTDGDYCLIITLYPGDDGTLLVLRVIDARWMIVAGGPRRGSHEPGGISPHPSVDATRQARKEPGPEHSD